MTKELILQRAKLGIAQSLISLARKGGEFIASSSGGGFFYGDGLARRLMADCDIRYPFFHSEYLEDKWIFQNLPVPKAGFFVDVGAGDGVRASNTYFFEKQRME